MKFLFAVLVALAVGSHQVTSQSCHLRELDLCAATLLLFQQGPNAVPQTDEDVDTQCGHIREAWDCVNNYTDRCTTPLQKELLGIVIEGGDSVVRDFCTAGSELRAQYLKHAPCLADAANDQRVCLKEIQVALEVVPKIAFNQRVTSACCAFQRMRKCATDLIEAKCGKDGVVFAEQTLARVVADLLNQVCSAQKDNPACDKLLPPPGTEPQGARSNSALSRLLSAYLGTSE